jgi:hypothetical protein
LRKLYNSLFAVILFGIIAAFSVVAVSTTTYAAPIPASIRPHVAAPLIKRVTCNSSAMGVLVYNDSTENTEAICFTGTGLTFLDQQIYGIFTNTHKVQLVTNSGTVTLNPGYSDSNVRYVYSLNILS